MKPSRRTRALSESAQCCASWRYMTSLSNAMTTPKRSRMNAEVSGSGCLIELLHPDARKSPGWHAHGASVVFGAHGTVLTVPLDDLPAIPGATPTSSFASSDLSKLTDQSIWPVSKRLSCTKRRPFRFECCDYRNK